MNCFAKFSFVLLLGAALSGCGSKKESSPKSTAMTFLAAVINDWGEHKMEFVDKATQKRLKEMAAKAKARGVTIKPFELLVSVPQARDDWLGKKETKILSQTETTAVVEISSSAPNAPKITLDLVREGGKWKVSLLK